MKITIQQLVAWGVALCRVTVGVLVIKSGYDLMVKENLFVFWNGGSSVAGVFTVVLGLVFVALGIFPQFFDKSDLGEGPRPPEQPSSPAQYKTTKRGCGS